MRPPMLAHLPLGQILHRWGLRRAVMLEISYMKTEIYKKESLKIEV